MTPGVVLSMEFDLPSTEPYGGWLEYIDRSEAVVLDYSGYQDYMDHPEKTSGLFSADRLFLAPEEKEKVKAAFDLAQENGSVLWRPIISFDNDWLAQNGLYEPETRTIDRNKLIECTRRSVAKMLENLSVFIGNCDFHIRFSFLFVIGFVECPHPAAASAVRMLLPAADAVIPAGDAQRLSVDKTRRDLLSGAFVDLLYGGTGNVHLGGTLLMGTLFQIHQPDDLIFVQRQQDRRSASAPVRAESIDLRFAADPSAPRWSRHSYAPFVFGICRL